MDRAGALVSASLLPGPFYPSASCPCPRSPSSDQIHSGCQGPPVVRKCKIRASEFGMEIRGKLGYVSQVAAPVPGAGPGLGNKSGF